MSLSASTMSIWPPSAPPSPPQAAGPLRTHPPTLEEQLGRLAVASEEECAWQALQQGHHWTLLFLVEVQVWGWGEKGEGCSEAVSGKSFLFPPFFCNDWNN